MVLSLFHIDTEQGKLQIKDQNTHKKGIRVKYGMINYRIEYWRWMDIQENIQLDRYLTFTLKENSKEIRVKSTFKEQF